jgi:hypothetical protein
MDTWDDVAQQMILAEVEEGMSEDASELAQLVLQAPDTAPERAGAVAKRVEIAARLVAARRDPFNAPYPRELSSAGE